MSRHDLTNEQWAILECTSSKHLIHDVAIRYGRMRDKPPIGTFACPHCGFTYDRTGPNEAESDRNKVTKMVAYGYVWDEQLKTYWYDDEISFKQLARLMKVGDGIAERQAIRLGLPFPKPGSTMSVREYKKHQEGRAAHDQRRESYRTLFLTERGNLSNPTAGSLIDALPPTVFYWLTKHDHTWLRSNMPPKRKTVQNRLRPNTISTCLMRR